MKLNSNDFQYLVLEKEGISDSPFLPQYTQAYEFWKSMWKPIFEKVGSPQAFVIDDFYRQDLVPVIMCKGEIVAAHYYSVFNLKNPATHEIRYFSIFPEPAMQWVNQHGQNRVMSMEFLTVHPQWRKMDNGFSFAEVIVCLGFQLMKQRQIGAMVGVAVKAAGIDKLAKDLSCSILSSEVKRGNLVCDIVSQTADNVRPSPHPEARIFVEELWAHYINSTQTQTTRRAA